ncbi:hypothetical protein F511_10965 [Dorcoceras hygrometricum]|uniref:Uncharacterized protein n=1 Tax=Dorcoceras hygrometricum TaxID=472368 RepID=A0A2Z7B0Y6_9LAMI|nr:hypothetical protein F511_10965 [Dorcoceras hygrometricum]
MGEGGGYNRGRYNMGPSNRPEMLGYDRGRAGPTPNRAAQQEKQGGGPIHRTPFTGHTETNKLNGGSNLQGGNNRRGEVKREGRILSQQEFLKRKEKGLCFRCGEAYSPLHKCAYKLIQVAVIEDDPEEEVDTDEAVEGEEEYPEETTECGTLELPLFSIGGVSQPQTLKLKGSIQGADVVIMIDSGASHNFISRPLGEKLGLNVDESVRFGVCLGDGAKVLGRGLCRDMQIDLGACKLTITGHLFDLGGVDVMLGVDWLRTLGEVRLDWGRMRMKFQEGDRVIELQGDPTLQRSLISFKSILKLTEVEYCATLVTVSRAEANLGGRLMFT